MSQTSINVEVKINKHGYAIVQKLLSEEEIDQLIKVFANCRINNRRGGVRNILKLFPEIHKLASSPRILELIAPILGNNAFPIKGIFFDKTPVSNWKVTWHQDLLIAVGEKRVVPGFGPWSKKDGIIHVQPPAQVLENILAVRLHLDDCGPDNGPVRVIPGSHCSGKIDPVAIETWCRDNPSQDCYVPRGGALLMRPLILHASSSSVRPELRRVIHLEYTSSCLPDELHWVTY